MRALQEVAKDLLGLDDHRLDIALQAGEIVEVRDGDKKPSGPSLKLLNLIERKGLEAVI